MVRVENVRSVDGNLNAVLDIQVSETNDLPDIGDSIGGYTVCAGSIAQIVQTGAFATLDDDGKWYSNGSEV